MYNGFSRSGRASIENAEQTRPIPGQGGQALMQIKLDSPHPLNLGVLQYLSRRKWMQAIIASPDSVKDPYLNQGSHPEVVERVWDRLGAVLPVDCRCLVYGTPALVHPASGIIFAFCCGTAYCLRLTPRGYQEAIKKGCKFVGHWSDDATTDARQEFGPDWIWGGWSVDEMRWCIATYERLNKLAGSKDRRW